MYLERAHPAFLTTLVVLVHLIVGVGSRVICIIKRSNLKNDFNQPKGGNYSR